MQISVIEFDSEDEAIQHVNASGRGKAIRLDGKPTWISEDDAHRLAAASVEFAYLCDHQMPDGSWRIMTVPVN